MKTIISDTPTSVSVAAKQIRRRKRAGIWLQKLALSLNPFKGKSREVQETYLQR